MTIIGILIKYMAYVSRKEGLSNNVYSELFNFFLVLGFLK
jgi:hypothetical protein